MKVFEFDPVTGRRGAQIDNVRRAAWTDSRWNEYDGHAPVGFGADADVTVHHNAGITSADGSEEISYRRDRWVCFSLGCWHMGVQDDGRPLEQWVWVILPPTSVRTRPTPGCVRCEKTLDGHRHQYACL